MNLVAESRSLGPHLLAAAWLIACTGPNPAYRPDREPGGSGGRPPAPPMDGSVDAAPGPPDAPTGTDAPVADVIEAAPVSDSAPDRDASAPRDLVPDDVSVSPTGLVLYWKFDEATGETALDSSPSGLHADDEGQVPPVHDREVPPTRFPNLFSRRFQASRTHGVRLAVATPLLRPTQGLTVSAWFRTTQMAPARIVGNSVDYFIDIAAPTVEFGRKSSRQDSTKYVHAAAAVPSAFDDKWHHVAGVAVDGKTELYLDGEPISGSLLPAELAYGSGSTTVGWDTSAGRNFEGWIDDVRIYARALAPHEIAALAAGAP